MPSKSHLTRSPLPHAHCTPPSLPTFPLPLRRSPRRRRCLLRVTISSIHSRTKHAINNRNLTEVAIDLAYSKAKDMRRDFDSLSDGAVNGSRLKGAYKSCSINYRDVVGDLKQSKRFFYHRKYKRVEVKASDAAEKTHECKYQIEKRDGSNSNLKKKNKEF